MPIPFIIAGFAGLVALFEGGCDDDEPSQPIDDTDATDSPPDTLVTDTGVPVDIIEDTIDTNDTGFWDSIETQPDSGPTDTQADTNTAPDTQPDTTTNPTDTRQDTGPDITTNPNDRDEDGYEACPQNPSAALKQICDCNDDNRNLNLFLTGYRDQDWDGYTLSTPEEFCTDGQLPDNYRSQASATEDCNDADDNRYRVVEGFEDSDGDAYTLGASMLFCTNGSLPSNYKPQRSNKIDCDDTNPDFNPGAVQSVGPADSNCDNLLALDITRDAIKWEGETPGDQLGIGTVSVAVGHFSGQANGLMALVSSGLHSLDSNLNGEGTVYLTPADGGRLGANNDIRFEGGIYWGVGIVHSMGDQNGDGYDDFLIGGNFGERGGLFYVHGRSPTSWADINDLPYILNNITITQSYAGFAAIETDSTRIGERNWFVDAVASYIFDVSSFDGRGEKLAFKLSENSILFLSKKDFWGRQTIKNILATDPGAYLMSWGVTLDQIGGATELVASGVSSTGKHILAFTDSFDEFNDGKGEVAFVLGSNTWPKEMDLAQPILANMPKSIFITGTETEENLGRQMSIHGSNLIISSTNKMYRVPLEVIAELIQNNPKGTRIPRTTLTNDSRVKVWDRGQIEESIGGVAPLNTGTLVLGSQNFQQSKILFLPNSSNVTDVLDAPQQATLSSTAGDSLFVDYRFNQLFFSDGAFKSPGDSAARGAIYMLLFQ